MRPSSILRSTTAHPHRVQDENSHSILFHVHQSRCSIFPIAIFASVSASASAETLPVATHLVEISGSHHRPRGCSLVPSMPWLSAVPVHPTIPSSPRSQQISRLAVVTRCTNHGYMRARVLKSRVISQRHTVPIGP